MSKISIMWKNYNILEIIQKKDIFYSSINIENTEKAVKEGMLINTVSKISVISQELPKLITNRIPQGKTRKEICKEHNITNEISDIEYLKLTKGQVMTDNITILID